MVELKEEEEYYEHINYREMLKLQPDNFYLHLPFQIPFSKWFFEARLQMLITIGVYPNYFGMRHRFDPQTQWFYDWVFLNYYTNDYQTLKKWTPSLFDFFRFKWLIHQGYAKESKYIFELFKRDQENKVTAQERRFLKKYFQCRFMTYDVFKENEELSFFHSSVFIDKTTKNQNRPLFPNITESYPDDPRLAYWRNKEMQTEYIPAESTWLTKLIDHRKITKKWQKGEKVTYADMRTMFNSDTIKIHDLEFILHVFGEHGGVPKDKKEMRLFSVLFKQYETEITHLAQMMQMPEFNKLTLANPKKRLNQLYVAYKQRWLGVNKVKDFEKVFHGVTKDEYQKIVNAQHELLEKKPHAKSKKKRDDKDVKKRIDNIILSIINQK